MFSLKKKKLEEKQYKIKFKKYMRRTSENGLLESQAIQGQQKKKIRLMK